MWRIRTSARGRAWGTTQTATSIGAHPLHHAHATLAHLPAAAAPAAAATAAAPWRTLHTCTPRAYGTSGGSDAPSHNPYLQRAPAEAPRAEPLLRERPAPTPAPDAGRPDASPALSGAELVAQQARDMDRATKAARAARMRARRTGTDWRARADARRADRDARVPLPAPPPIYFPAPFAALPVIPAATETLESALIRVDKVPKSPGFGKEVSRIRGQLAKYNFTARRQLEVAELELATKLQQRIDAFPKLRKRRRAANGALVPLDGAEGTEETASHDPFAAQLHPYDHALVELSLERGGAQYTSLLNHCRNLVQKLRGAAKQGLKGLNHSRNMSDSRAAHMGAIARMKTLWKTGDAPSPDAGSAGPGSNGGAGQRSGMELVEELRGLSKMLRHIPTIEFDRNLLDVKRHPASYLSVLPQEFFFLPEDQLTFEKLRPYLPPSPTYTFSLVGAPNVGKSSILSALSNAKVEVRNFAFTTTALQVGHLQREEQESPSMRRAEAMTTGARRKPSTSPYPQPSYTPAVPLTTVQLVDTPGILFRPDSMRKSVEHLTLALCSHIQPLILAFVLDPTGTSGAGVRVQRFLRREMRQRFSFFTPPHPLASDTDPRNHQAHDPMYANVAASAELQSLTRRLQTIPWLTLRSKADVKRRECVPDEVLARAQGGAEREVRLVEEELLAHNRAVLDEVDQEEEQPEGEAVQPQQTADKNSTDGAVVVPPAEGSASQTGTELALSPVAPARMDRAAWKLASIREHMHKYLVKEDGTFALEEEDEAFGVVGPSGRLRQLAPSAAASAAAATSASASATGAFSQAPHMLPTPTLSVSTESGQGLSELAAHIWFEVDQRESLRLEKAYKEMKARIQWIRSSHVDLSQHTQIPPTPMHQPSQIEAASSTISIE